MIAAAVKASAERHETYREIYLGRLGRSVRKATPEQLVTILRYVRGLDGRAIRTTFLEWRDDDAETLTKIALALDPACACRELVAACAVVKCRSEGVDVPQELLSALTIAPFGPPNLSWVETAIARAIPDESERFDLHRVADLVCFADEDSPAWRSKQVLVDALRSLDEEARTGCLREALGAFNKDWVAPYLFLVEDETFWKEAIDAIVETPHSQGELIAFGLGLLPLRALPLLLEARERAPQEQRDSYERAALLCITRSLERRETLEDAALERLHFDFGGTSDMNDWDKVLPLLRKAIVALPREQAESALLKGLDETSPTRFARAFRMLGAHPSRAVLTAAMHGLLDIEDSIEFHMESDIEAGLRSLPTNWGLATSPADVRREHVKWLLRNGAGAKLEQIFERIYGWADYAALKKEVDSEAAS